jgi:riboflavin kinase / FMN adenylyltransferase
MDASGDGMAHYAFDWFIGCRSDHLSHGVRFIRDAIPSFEVAGMKLVRYLSSLYVPRQGSVVTIGSFDGLHLGHQQLLHTTLKQANEHQLSSIVITFEPQPYEYFHQKRRPRIMRLREKWATLAQMGLDLLLCLRFNAHIAQLTAHDFVKQLLVDKLKAKCIVIGDDFCFGANRVGDVVLLKQLGLRYGFSVIQLPTYIYQNRRVSSTYVRDALTAGNMQLVELLLGRAYYLIGRVRRGDQLGRQLGFPTANINVHRSAVPLHGIYVVRVLGLGSAPLYGAANVGTRPTVGGTSTLLEVFIFDFEQDIYGLNIKVEFLHKLRDEEHYSSLDILKKKIADDVEQAKQYVQRL